MVFMCSFLMVFERPKNFFFIHSKIYQIDLGAGMILNGGGQVPPSSKQLIHSLDLANFHSTSARSYIKNQKKKERTEIIKWKNEQAFNTHQRTHKMVAETKNDKSFYDVKKINRNNNASFHFRGDTIAETIRRSERGIS